ncbi:MAG: hypothetical protein DRI69_00345 [Bacteroidetes bacterium]|nr:MAG: hypothetical protein DRI69_00345 [Bacteroidota bacterium]
MSSVNATCSFDNGSIELTFADDPDRSGIEFSLDGGVSYLSAVNDAQSSIVYDSLPPGTYEVWARWDTDECPVLVGVEIIVNISCGVIRGVVSEITLGPLSGVILKLYADADSNGQADGPLLSSQISAPDSGTYAFALIPVGNYVIVQEQPEFYNDLSDYDHSTGVFDPDGVDTAGVGTDNDIPVTLAADEVDADNNFIETANFGTVSGFVLNDGGLGIDNVTIEIYHDDNADGNKDGAVISQMLTDSDGSFAFPNVIPGYYVLEQIQPSSHISLSDYDETPDPDGDDSEDGPDDNIPVHITPGEIDDGNIFREDRYGSIKGSVKLQNGTPLPNVFVILYADTNGDGAADGSPIGFYNTGSTGAFSFNNRPPGSYVLVETQPVGYTDVRDYDVSTGPFDPDGVDTLGVGADNDIPVTLAPNEIDAGNAFVDGAPGSICGTVLTDTGRPISNVKIWLYADSDNDGEPDGTALDSVYADGDSGNFCFADIFSGSYVLVEEQPEFYSSVSDYDHTIDSLDMDGDDRSEGPDDNIPVILSPGEEDEDNIFIEDPFPGVITGFVVDQLNAPIENVLIRLYADDDFDGIPNGPVIDSNWTNAIGEFQFTGVEPDGYLLIEEQPANYSSISDFDETPDGDGNDNNLGANDQIPVIIHAGELDDGNNFKEGSPGSICGNVRDDRGIPMPNVLIELFEDIDADQLPDGGAIAFVFSDSVSGNYCFENVAPSQYLLIETQPAQYQDISDYDTSIDSFDLDGDDRADGPDNDIPVVLTPGESDTGNDFVEDPDSSFIRGIVENEIGGKIFGIKIRLFEDFNKDGLQDGLPIDSVYSDFDGTFVFNDVHPGTYVLVEEQPFAHGNIEDYDVTPDPDGDDRFEGPDDNIPVVLVAGEDDAGNTFIDARPGAICGTVFTLAGNPISNVKIWLYADDDGDGNPDGDPLDSLFADSDTGNYCFEDIEPRDYVLVEEQPEFYNSVDDYDHTIDSLDTDGDDRVDGTDDNIPVTLSPGEEDEDNIFIEDPFPGEIHGAVVDEVGSPILNVLLRLYEDFNNDQVPDGSPIDSVLTNAIGKYQFTGVIPNGYLVIEEQPDGYSSISDFDESADGDGNDNAAGANDQIPVVIFPGELDKDNNFVEGRPGGICGNIRDERGVPLPNIQIELYADLDGDQIPDGDTIAVVFSDSVSGNYCFDNIVPSQYLLVQIQPDDYESVADFDQSVDSLDADGDDSGDGPDNNIPVILVPGESDTGNDFIEDPDPAIIRGIVENDIGIGLYLTQIKLYEDYNSDGEPDGMAIDSVLTDAAGLFLFSDMYPGVYVLVEKQPLFHGNIEDYDLTPDPDGDDRFEGADDNIPVVLKAGEDDADNTFIDSRPGSICGNVYDDLGNPLSNVQLVLYYDNDGDGEADGAALDTAFSESDAGNYCFTDLKPSDYVVVELQPDGYGDLYDYDVTTDLQSDPDGADTLGGPDNDIPVVLSPGEDDDGNKFVDIDCPSIPQLIGDSLLNVCHGDVVTFIADEQNLGSEEYSWVFGDGASPALATGPGPHDVVYDTTGLNQSVGAQVSLAITKTGCGVQQVQVANVKVHTTPESMIDAATSDLCWYKHRTFKPGEAELSGVDYYWDFGVGAIPETATGYGPHDVVFTVEGQAVVRLILSSSYPEINCTDTSEVSFNIITCLGHIAGTVLDDEGNPIGNVLLILYADDDLDGLPPDDESDFVKFAATTSEGQYLFGDIQPGSYVIKELQPNGYASVLDEDTSEDFDSVANLIQTDDLIPVTVEPLVSDFNNNFIEAILLGSIEGYVFEDSNMNGAPDGEEGRDSVVVQLFADFNKDGIADTPHPLDSTLTDSSGLFEFTDVSPAAYVIVEIQPEGYLSVRDVDISEDVDEVLNTNQTNDTIPLTVGAGELDRDNYFIERKIIPNIVVNTLDSGPGSLRYAVENTTTGDTVWFDPDLAGDTIRIVSEMIFVNKNLVIYADAQPKIQVKSDVPGLIVIGFGQSVEIYNLGMMSGVSGNPAVIDNDGVLILHDIDLYRNPVLPPGSNLVRNRGDLIIRGLTSVRK